jgi:PLP dependent protein
MFSELPVAAESADCYSCRSISLLNMSASLESEDEIQTRVRSILDRISAAAHRAGRRAEEITLVAVSKTHPAEAVRGAVRAGITNLGENRVQEAETKIVEVGRDFARWHLIGHLQSNKARRAVQLFDVIHSLDSVGLARRLDRACAETERAPLPVLVQVDLGHELTKSGVTERDLPALLEAVAECRHLKLIGLMTLPPFFEQAEATRSFFGRLRALRDEAKEEGRFGNGAGELSMGMTHDFEIAIEEGATMVRVGTAIFGRRG